MAGDIDIAIVGGGASGIYSAWRLAQASGDEVAGIRRRIGGEGPLKVTVFERSKRLGGRLLSASAPAMPSVPLELGGMRYLNTQPLVKGLVEKKLDLRRHRQDVDEPDNIAYLRGRMFRQSDLHLPGVELPYGLTEREKWVVRGASTPAELIFWAVFQEFPQIQGMQPDALARFLQAPEAKVDGRPLFRVGFWNLLARHLSNEGRKLAITAIGYDVLGANANAVDIIAENFDFTPNTEYFLFDEGFESVIWRLADEFRAKGGTIVTDRSLASFECASGDDPASGLALSFEKGDPATARSLVLAMPPAAIRRLLRRGPLLDPTIKGAKRVRRLMSAVEGIPLYKLFVIYERPWWQEQLKLEKGRSLTDLPVRQCYYWATNPGGPSAIMAYNDQASTSFWGGFQAGALGPLDTSNVDAETREMLFERRSKGDPEPANDDQKRRLENWTSHKAPHDMVVEMHRQLMEMHGVTDAPFPIDAAFMDWMNEPYGGAVHFWNPGHKSWKVRHEMTQPIEGLNVFVVGEAYSTNQTWVEGAFQTSEIFLQQRLGMKMPDWVCDAGLT